MPNLPSYSQIEKERLLEAVTPSGTYQTEITNSGDFFQTKKVGRGQGTGWKFHLSVDARDAPQAYDLVTPILEKHGVESFKVSTPDTLNQQISRNYNSAAAAEQMGKNIVIYDTGSVKDQQQMLREIEATLKSHGIRSAGPLSGDAQIAGSSYINYRNDFDPLGNYLEADVTRRLPLELQHNPYPTAHPDIYARMNVASDPVNTSLTNEPLRPAVQDVRVDAGSGEVPLSRTRPGVHSREDLEALHGSLQARGVDSHIRISQTSNQEYLAVHRGSKPYLIDELQRTTQDVGVDFGNGHVPVSRTIPGAHTSEELNILQAGLQQQNIGSRIHTSVTGGDSLAVHPSNKLHLSQALNNGEYAQTSEWQMQSQQQQYSRMSASPEEALQRETTQADIAAERLRRQSLENGAPAQRSKVVSITEGREPNLAQGSLHFDPQTSPGLPTEHPGRPFLVKAPEAQPAPLTGDFHLRQQANEAPFQPFSVGNRLETQTVEAHLAADSATSALEKEAGALGREASGASRALKIGGAVAPTVFGAVIEGGTAAAQGKSKMEIAKATGHGAVNGAFGVDDWKTGFAKNEDHHLTWLDQKLAIGRAATATTATVGLVGSFTPAAPIATPTAAAAGIANLGLGVIQDVAHWTGHANNKGTLESSYDVVKAFDQSLQPTEVANNALYRSLLPLNSVAHSLFQDPETLHKVSPQLGRAIYHFNDIHSQDPATRVEEGSQFAKQLAQELRAQGPGGDAIRKSMEPALQKAGTSPAEYAQALDTYAHELDKVDGSLKAMKPGEYAKVVQQSADHLESTLNSKPSSKAPSQELAHGAIPQKPSGRRNMAAMAHIKDEHVKGVHAAASQEQVTQQQTAITKPSYITMPKPDALPPVLHNETAVAKTPTTTRQVSVMPS